MIEFSFENCIESTALAHANNFYHKGIIPINSSLCCETISKHHGRDVEEALLLYATLFPYAYKYVGEIENIKRNAI
jgi:hypothetical protein